MPWLNPQDWKLVQDSVPICCVDVVPIKRSEGGNVAQVGLILRDTPHQGRRWCIVGGRMLRNETLAEAATRQLRQTLGDAVTFRIAPDAQPHFVAQYFTAPRDVGLFDPRQHAIGMTFLLELDGPAIAQGEAFEFRWFDVNSLPPSDDFGFGQDEVVRACLRRQ